jgi:hypothetical protein
MDTNQREYYDNIRIIIEKEGLPTLLEFQSIDHGDVDFKKKVDLLVSFFGDFDGMVGRYYENCNCFFIDNGFNDRMGTFESDINILITKRGKSISKDLDACLVNLLEKVARLAREKELRYEGRTLAEDAVIDYFNPVNEESVEVFRGKDKFWDGLQNLLAIRVINNISLKFLADKKSAIDVTEEWDKKIKEVISDNETEVSKIKEELKDQRMKLNFTKLSRGFNNMLKGITWELRFNGLFLVILGGLIFLIPVLLKWYNVDSLNPFVLGRDSKVIGLSGLIKYIPSLMPFVGVELILFYFFRIFLLKNYSIKAQKVQLKLRLNLCAFIEDYVDFAIRSFPDGDQGRLEKFEALIFSGIVLDQTKVPTTVDGVEQVGKLLQSFKSTIKAPPSGGS